MEPLTSAWTDRHTRIALLVLAVAVATTAGVLEDPPVTAWVAAAVVVAACLPLVLDMLGGLVVGFVVAAALVGARRATGVWSEAGFEIALVETVAIVLAAVAAGRAGVALRHDVAPEDASGAPRAGVEPVFGSLGLLDADTGMLRLEEEVERARAHGRPLALVLLQIDILEPSLDPAARSAAQRSVARLLESRVHDGDVPFALARDRIAAILPETDRAAALERVGDVLEGVATGRFAARSEGTDRALADTVQVTIGTAVLGQRASRADQLLDAAATALASARAERQDAE